MKSLVTETVIESATVARIRVESSKVVSTEGICKETWSQVWSLPSWLKWLNQSCYKKICVHRMNLKEKENNKAQNVSQMS